MKNETHEHAIALKSDIAELRSHKDNVLRQATDFDKCKELKGTSFRIHIIGASGSCSAVGHELKSRHMLIDKGKMIELYLEAIDKELASLEKQFNDL